MRWLPQQQVIAVGDSSNAIIDLLDSVRPYVTVITRLRFDATLYDLASARAPGSAGPAAADRRAPALLREVAQQAATVWTPLTLPADARGRQRRVEVATDTALWYHRGKAPVPIRWVLVRQGEEISAFLSAGQDLTAADILGYFTRR